MTENGQNIDIAGTQRLQSVDILRGIALLGLPTMNIIHFSMPQAAYMNPMVYKADAFLNHFLFSFFTLFSDQKFMGLFTLLFGASILFLRDKNIAKAIDASLIHYSRMFFLLLIGMFHFWFIWSGDVLIFYALMGIMLYPLARLPSKVLLGVSSLFLTLTLYFVHMPNVTLENLGEDGFEDMSELYAPSEQFIESYGKSMLGSYADTMGLTRSENEDDTDSQVQSDDESSLNTNTERVFLSFFFFIVFKIATMVTLGMVLYKEGVIQGHKSKRFYYRLALYGIIIGLAITSISLLINYQHEWAIDVYFSQALLIKELGSIFITLGYVGLFICLLKSRSMTRTIAKRIARYAARVGQMALTNYLLQSILCALLFYGLGLGLYGSVSRLGLLPIIVGVCSVNIVFSNLWLRYFVQGPIEWLWRCASMAKVEPLKRVTSSH